MIVTLGELMERLEHLRDQHGEDLPVYEYVHCDEFPVSLLEVCYSEACQFTDRDFGTITLPDRIVIN